MRSALRSVFSSRWAPVWGSVAIVVLPIVVAAIRAAAGAWVPTGDDAYFTVRSRDVLTANHPLVGAWSSGSLDRTSVNNLGPLQFDLLAPFTRWTPFGGTAIGTATINVLAVVVAAFLLGRVVGRTAVLVAMPVIGLLTWTMGSEMLITPRQHQAMILPYLCFLVAAWAVARGDRWAMVVGVVAGSLVAQTHLSYPILVAMVAIAAVVLHAARTRQRRDQASRRPYAFAIAIGVVLWAQPLIVQFFGDGNIGTALFSSGEGGQAGMGDGIGLVARILISPNTLIRPGFQRYDALLAPAASGPVVVVLVALVAAVAWCSWLLGRGALSRASGPLIAVVAVGAGILNATLLPQTAFGYPVGNYRWLWATATFVVIVALADLVPNIDAREPRGDSGPDARAEHRWVSSLALAACAVPALANLWPTVEYDQEAVYRRQTSEVADVLDQLAAADLPDTLIVETDDVTFGNPLVFPVLVELQRQDVEFRFDSDKQISRFGSGRRTDGSEQGVLTIITGDGALAESDNPQVVAFADSLAGLPAVILFELREPRSS